MLNKQSIQRGIMIATMVTTVPFLAGCANTMNQLGADTCMERNASEALGGVFQNRSDKFNKECGEGQAIGVIAQVPDPKVQAAAAYMAKSSLSPETETKFNQTAQKLGLDEKRLQAQAKVGEIVAEGQPVCTSKTVELANGNTKTEYNCLKVK